MLVLAAAGLIPSGAAAFEETGSNAAMEAVTLPALSLTGDSLDIGAATEEGMVDLASDILAVEQAGDAVEVAWDATAVDPAALDGPALGWRVETLEGPGEVRVEAADAPPEARLMVEAGSAGWSAWTFPEPGSYQLALEVSGSLEGGATTEAVSSLWVEVAPQAEPTPPDPEPTAAEASPTPSEPDDLGEPSDPSPEPEPSVTTTAPEPDDPSAPDRVEVRSAEPEGSPEADDPGSPGPSEATDPPASLAAAPLAQQQNTQEQGTQSETVILDDVHLDVAARMSDGEIRVEIKDGTDPAAPVYRDPGTVVMHAKPDSETTIPDSPGFAFLGEPGDRIWLLPQTQQAGLVWPGWNTETLTSADVTGAVSWRLLDVDGPGEFALFLTTTLGAPEVLFDSRDGLPDAMDIPIGTHAHGNWAFSAEGVYRLSVEMSASTPGGGTASDQAVLTMAVGDVDPSTVTPVGGGGSGGGGNGDGAGGDGSGGSGDRDGAGTGGDGNGGRGGLPNTGFDAGDLVRAGVALIAGGSTILIAASRRRRQGEAT